MSLTASVCKGSSSPQSATAGGSGCGGPGAVHCVSCFSAWDAGCLRGFFFSSRRRHTIFDCDWSSDVCSSDLELYPQFFSRAELAYRRAVYGWTVRRSRIVITISQHAASGLVERLGLDSARVRPIHLGIEIGRASGRGRGEISVVAGSFKKKKE